MQKEDRGLRDGASVQVEANKEYLFLRSGFFSWDRIFLMGHATFSEEFACCFWGRSRVRVVQEGRIIIPLIFSFSADCWGRRNWSRVRGPELSAVVRGRAPPGPRRRALLLCACGPSFLCILQPVVQALVGECSVGFAKGLLQTRPGKIIRSNDSHQGRLCGTGA